MPVRRRHDPIIVPRHHYGGSVRHDYGIDDSISRADYLSNAILTDTYDAATRSRGRDQELMRSVNNAIVNTEQHISPKAAVVARRVRASTVPPTLHAAPAAPAQSQVIRTRQVEEYSPKAKPYLVVLANNHHSYSPNPYYVTPKPVADVDHEAPWYARARASSVAPVDRHARSASVPPRAKRTPPSKLPPEPLPTSHIWAHRPIVLRSRASSVEPQRRASVHADVAHARAASFIPTATVWAHRPLPLRKDAMILARARINAREAENSRYLDLATSRHPYIPDVKEKALTTYLYAHRGRFGPTAKPPRPKLSNFPQVYVPWHGIGPSNRSKRKYTY